MLLFICLGSFLIFMHHLWWGCSLIHVIGTHAQPMHIYIYIAVYVCHTRLLHRNSSFRQWEWCKQEEQKLNMSGAWLISTMWQIGTSCSTECSLPPCINEPRRRKAEWTWMFELTGFLTMNIAALLQRNVPRAPYLLLKFNRICF